MSNEQKHAQFIVLAQRLAEISAMVPTEQNMVDRGRLLGRIVQMHRWSQPDATL